MSPHTLLAADRNLVVIEVTGPDRHDYLNDVTSQEFNGRDPGEVAGTLVLDGKGVPKAIAWVLFDAERILLLAPPEAGDHIMDVVAKQTFLAQASFERLDLPVTSLGSVDDGAVAAVLGHAGIELGVDSWVAHDDLLVVNHAFAHELVGLDPDGVVELLGSIEDDVAVQVVAGEDLSLAVGEPRLGHEVVAGRLPEEYGLLATHVHMSKGCYPGQEPIAHMWMLGRPRRRLARVHVAAPAHDDEAVTGHVGDRGLAWVGRDARPDDSPATGVTITAFVGDDRDVVGWTPNQTRNRDRESPPKLSRRAP